MIARFSISLGFLSRARPRERRRIIAACMEGWQRPILLIASQVPRPSPCSTRTSRAYSEQLARSDTRRARGPQHELIAADDRDGKPGSPAHAESPPPGPAPSRAQLLLPQPPAWTGGDKDQINLPVAFPVRDRPRGACAWRGSGSPRRESGDSPRRPRALHPGAGTRARRMLAALHADHAGRPPGYRWNVGDGRPGRAVRPDGCLHAGAARR